MLERLSVRGLGIIASVELELDSGFTVLTGETGAGKSLLVESLKLLGGQRAQSDMVRTGDERLQVEGVFRIEPEPPLRDIFCDLGISPSDAIVLRREVTEVGRGRAWINDVSVTAGALQAIAPFVIAIHGQHEQHGLADGRVQRRLVDDFGSHHDLLAKVRQQFEAWRAAADTLEELKRRHAMRRDRLDAITYQLQEIERVGPVEGEDEELRRRRSVLRHSARIAELSSSIVGRLSDDDPSVVDGLARSERDVEAIAECGVILESGAARLREARIQVEEVVREIQALAADASADPDELESTEARLHALDKLMLKYGSTLAEVLAHRDGLVRERGELESVEERLDQASVEAQRALTEFDSSAAKLDDARATAGAELAAEVGKVLDRLAMGGTRLEFQWRPRPDASSPLTRDGEAVAFDADGVEECVLMIAANPGEEPRPLARIASGGELSRVHLALRTVLRGRQPAGGLTLLFDEVDSGLGGPTAAALAELLADLAATDQVLVVTHLPQVAARARGHFRVEKVVTEGRATTRVSPLDPERRADEVARMLAGGRLTDSARAHARVLLEGT